MGVKPRGGRPTIADVARTAAVSPATVSRVLNETTPVSGDLVERVRRAASAAGYQPFGPARALRLRRTPIWSVIVADIENSFFTSVVRGVEDVAREHGFRLVLGNSDEDVAQEAAYFDIAITENMAGIVLAPASTSDSHLDLVLDAGIPVVAVDRRPTGHTIDSVLVDNRLGAELAVEHLLEAGYERLACITGPNGLSTARERHEGFTAAVRRATGKASQRAVRRANFRRDGGYRAAHQLLGSASPPDALFVANNMMTLGVLEAIRELGLRVPEDVGIVCFDDASWAPLIEPSLTVVAQPAREIGRQAGALLAAGPGHQPREVVLIPDLVVRRSSQR